uniref:C-type lectin domain-containing protein n=1 Tax=Panagrolaimus sp. JU765 TaxID=591449 RepID=A0AC34RKD6_9BILA
MFAGGSAFNFNSAQEICQKQNANVVSIHNEAENTIVGKLTTLEQGFKSHIVGVWIGLTYSNGAWNWTDGTTFNYQAWGDQDPDNVDRQKCVVFYPDGASDDDYDNYIMQWDTSTCTDNFLRVVCKKDSKSVPISEKP